MLAVGRQPLEEVDEPLDEVPLADDEVDGEAELQLVVDEVDDLANVGGLLEQLLARSKRLRDTEAATLNMQLVTWRDGQAANDAFVAGTGEALRTWRQK